LQFFNISQISISIEAENSHLILDASFIFDSSSSRLIRYFVCDYHVAIIEILASSSFCVMNHTMAHNLASLYEGHVIPKANSPSKLGHFIPFSCDSGGGIASMFFLSEFESNRSDVIIDYGFTKLFTELATDGTLRYVQNIAALTVQCEKHLRQLGQKGPKTFRPAQFTFPIDEPVRKTHPFKQRAWSGPFDVLYLCDATGSMDSTIQAAKDQCVTISRELASKLSDLSVPVWGCFLLRSSRFEFRQP
jgi:hypothetical protein